MHNISQILSRSCRCHRIQDTSNGHNQIQPNFQTIQSKSRCLARQERERGGVKPARGLSYIVETYPDLDHGAALERERRQVRLQPQLVVLGHDVGRQSLEGRLGR